MATTVKYTEITPSQARKMALEGATVIGVPTEYLKNMRGWLQTLRGYGEDGGRPDLYAPGEFEAELEFVQDLVNILR